MKETKPILANGKPIGNGTLPIVITPLVGKTQAAILDEVAAIIPKTPDLLEWRIDFFEAIGNTQAVIETALAIRAASKGIPVLLTRRNASEGGQPLTIAEPAVVAMYTAACEAKCVELIDYELSNASGDKKFATAAQLGADVAKVAVMPQSDRDVLELLAATSRARETLDLPLISMSMGGIGSISRIMGWIYGSAATFAVGKSSSAPGQIAIEELRTTLAIVRQAVLGK
jgi:3-dehydroquinate dehydratase-1